jgi:hypothetical protein
MQIETPNSGKSNLAVSNEFPKYILIQATESKTNPITVCLYPILGKTAIRKNNCIVLLNAHTTSFCIDFSTP